MLTSWIFWMAVACCAIAQIAIVRSSLVSRAAAVRATRSRGTSELAWVFLPPVALSLVLFLTWRAIEAHDATEELDGAARSAQSAADIKPLLSR